MLVSILTLRRCSSQELAQDEQTFIGLLLTFFERICCAYLFGPFQFFPMYGLQRGFFYYDAFLIVLVKLLVLSNLLFLLGKRGLKGRFFLRLYFLIYINLALS